MMLDMKMKNFIQASMSNPKLMSLEINARLFPNEHVLLRVRDLSLEHHCLTRKGELKAITTRSGLVLDGPFVPMPPPFSNPKEDERAEETLTDPELAEYTIKVPPPLVQKAKPISLKNYVVHKMDPLYPNISYPSRMHQEKQQKKDEEKLLELPNTPLNKNCSAVILKKLPEKLGDPGKFLIPFGFSELKCKALTDLGPLGMKLMHNSLTVV
ncbi:hypothetical protein Tco_0221583 [Tanacetum coccineum]